MQDWERTLAHLRENGWSYAYIKCIDLEKGTDAFYVSIRRGEESLISLRPTLEEAVHSLSHLAEVKAQAG
jgi:hypothetical protein